jgi:hypothetical protein
MKSSSVYFTIAFVAMFYLAPLIEWMRDGLYAQAIGIGSTAFTPDPSAMLEIRADNKGLLIPLVALTGPTDATTIPNPATSLLVYNTNTAGGLTPGYYYNAGTPASPNWVPLLNGSSPSDVWLTLGNAGTNPSTHFVGTTDNEDLVFRTNNTERIRITADGSVGIETTNPASKLHVNNGNILISKSNSENDNALLSVHYPQGKSAFLIGTFMGWDQNTIYIPGYNRIDPTTSIAGVPITINKVVCGGGDQPYSGLPVYASNFYTTSSRKLKTDIKPLNYGLKEILALQPVQYVFNYDPKKIPQIGLIAEDVVNVIPEVVSVLDKDGNLLSPYDKNGVPVAIDYSKLSVVIINAIKDQQKDIQQLQEESDQIKSEVKALAEKMNNLINILSAENKVGNK